MKKFIISAVLLGTVCVGSMAFIQNTNDNPPARQQQHRHGYHNGNGHCGEWRGQYRRGGCCRQEDSRQDRRGYDCCDYGQRCDACHYDRCTVDGCHERGELCPECRQYQAARQRDDVYRRR